MSAGKGEALRSPKNKVGNSSKSWGLEILLPTAFSSAVPSDVLLSPAGLGGAGAAATAGPSHSPHHLDPLHLVLQRESQQFVTTLQRIPTFRDAHAPAPYPLRRPRQFVARNAWSTTDDTKTNHACVAMCLGALGWDEGQADDPRPGLPRIYCWRQPKSLAETPVKAVDRVGAALEAQYEAHRKGMYVRVCLNPTAEELKDVLHKLRRAAGADKVLFHYTGHACIHRERENVTVPLPRPDRNYFFVMSNKGTPVPFQVEELMQLAGFPHVLVFDCPGAGTVLSYIRELMRKEELEQTQRLRATSGYTDRGAASAIRGECLFLGACGANEALPSHPLLPNDIFTACLTTPVQTSILWFIVQHRQFTDIHPMMAHCIPGMLEDRRTPLGELKWIFVAITDCIAWASVPQEQFFRLFRQDLFVVAMFRGFLLADRVIANLGCTPQSFPRIPSTAQHPLWNTWDCVLDSALSAVLRCLRPRPTAAGLSLADLRTSIDIASVPRRIQLEVVALAASSSGAGASGGGGGKGGAGGANAPKITPSTFFWDELKSFHASLYELQRDTTVPPHLTRLAIIPHALCSVATRREGLFVLARLVDRGAWAVDQCEQVRIYNEVLNRLWSNTVVELRELLVFVFCKSVLVDPLLIPHDKRADAVAYLIRVVREPTSKGQLGVFSTATCQQLLALSTLLLLGQNHVATLDLCVSSDLIGICARLLESLCGFPADPATASSTREGDRGQPPQPSVREEHFTTQLKVAACAMIACTLYSSGDAAVSAVLAIFVSPLSLLLADPSSRVRRAVIRVLHTLVCSPLVSQDCRDAVARLVMGHSRIEGSMMVRIEIINLLCRVAIRSAAVFGRISGDDFKKLLTPTLNASRRDSVSAAAGVGFSPASLPPAALAIQSPPTFTADEDDAETPGTSPLHASPYPSSTSATATATVLTPFSTSNPWYRTLRGGAQEPPSPFSLNVASPSSTEGCAGGAAGDTKAFPAHPATAAPSPAATDGTPAAQAPACVSSSEAVAMAIVHLLSVFSIDMHVRVRAFGCKALSELSQAGHIPYTTQPSQRAETSYTPKPTNFDRVVNLFRKPGSKSGHPPAHAPHPHHHHHHHGGGGGPPHPHPHPHLPPESLTEADLLSHHLEVEEFDVALKEINLDDLSTIADFVHDTVGFLGVPLLIAPADSDPRNPANRCFRADVDGHLRAVSDSIAATVAAVMVESRFVSKATAETDARSIMFHPSENHLVTTDATDGVSIWRYEEKEKELRKLNVFRLGEMLNRVSHPALRHGGGGGVSSGNSSGHQLASNSAPGTTPKTPTGSSSRGALRLHTMSSASAVAPLRCRISAAALVDAAHRPLLALASVDGSVTLVSNYSHKSHASVLTTFRTMVHEHAIHSHQCALAYQPLAQHVHVSGWMGLVSSWDLATELMVAEYGECRTAATCLSAHPSSATCFAAGFSNGQVLLFDTRTPRGCTFKSEVARAGSCMSIMHSKVNPHCFTVALSSGVVVTWDERRLGSYAKGRLPERLSLIQPREAGQQKGPPAALGIENVTAVDMHLCGSVARPVAMHGSGKKLRITVGTNVVTKIGVRAQVHVCAWHPNLLLGAFAVGGKLTMVDRPAISDAAVASEMFDL